MVLCYCFFSDGAVSVHPVGRRVITMILHLVIFITLHLFVALDLWIYPIVYTFFVFVLRKPFN